MNKVVGLEPDSSHGPNGYEGTWMVYKNDIAKCSHALTDCETIIYRTILFHIYNSGCKFSEEEGKPGSGKTTSY